VTATLTQGTTGAVRSSQEGLGRAAPCGCRKIPPADVALEYVRARNRGIVHIITWHAEATCTWRTERERRALPDAIAVTLLPVLCGKTIRMPHAERGTPEGTDLVTTFRDGDLCMGCVHALGAHDRRAFEGRVQPDDCTACHALKDDCDDLTGGRTCCSECRHP
jgi:hypothetical protein